MNYIYHGVPKNMNGNILYPLNTLKEKLPEIYKLASKKYVDREKVMEVKIPPLNCLWSDVLHFSAIHPSLIRQALIDSGDTTSYKMEFLEIDPHLLKPEDTVIYLYKHENVLDVSVDNFTTFNPDDLAQYSILPEETKAYYNKCFAEGKKPLLFHKVAHIFYKGALDVTNMRKIEL